MADTLRSRTSRLAALGILAIVAFTGFIATQPAEARDVSNGSGATVKIGLPDPVYSIVLDGDRGYVLGSWIVAVGWGGWIQGSALSVYDFASADPTHPLGTLQLWSGPSTLAVQDGLAYLAGNDYFTIVDLSDPANIHEVGNLPLLTNGPQGCVAVGGRLAYVGDTAGLHVVDVADPAAPSLLGSVALSGKPMSVALAGSFAYVGTQDARVSVVDLSDPLTPMVVAGLSLPAAPWAIEIRGARAYVAGGESGLQVLDVSRPAEPSLMGGVDTPGFASDVSLSGARAYVADGTVLRVIDISNPSHPAITNSVSVNLPPAFQNSVTLVSASQSRLALGGGGFRTDVDCLAGFGPPCNLYGYLEAGRTQDYGPATPGLSRAAGLEGAHLGGNPSATPQPAGFALVGNEPNPFNPETSIHFDVPHASTVRIRIVDARGSLVQTLVDGTRSAGRHEVPWRGRNVNGNEVPSGVYFVTMEAEAFRQTLKITLLK